MHGCCCSLLSHRTKGRFAIQYWIIFEDVHRDLYLKFCSIAGSSTHQRGASLYGTLQNLLYQTLDITTHSLKM